jgi:hypothetical protein
MKRKPYLQDAGNQLSNCEQPAIYGPENNADKLPLRRRVTEECSQRKRTIITSVILLTEIVSAISGSKDVISLSDDGKMNPQLIANEENQDRTQCRENESSRMKSFVLRAQKHVRNSAAEDGTNDAQHHRP